MYILVDFNYIFYRILFAKSTGVTYPSGLADQRELQRDILASIHNTIIQYPNVTGVIVCVDSGTSWRTTIPGNDQYKANRTERNTRVDMDSAMLVLNKIITTLQHYNIPVLKVPTIEADDWCCCVSSLLYKKGVSSMILSGDKDLLQLLKATPDYSTYVVMYNQFDMKHYVPSTIPDISGDIFSLDKIGNLGIMLNSATVVDPATISYTKIMSGDKSDNVPSAYTYVTKSGKSTFGFTEKRVQQLLESKKDTPSLSTIVSDSLARISLAKAMVETVSTRDSPDDIEVLHSIETGLIRNINTCYLNPVVYPTHVKTSILNTIKDVLSKGIPSNTSSILSMLVSEYTDTSIHYTDL